MRTLLTVGLGLTSMCFPMWAAMPAAEQNALVSKYCAVCHTDASMNGGLSLQHYDAARRDPALARMILSKLNNGAMGAAGNGVPDKAAQRDWLESTREQSAGATEWFVSREGGAITASIVREAPARKPGVADLAVYRLRIACTASTGVGQMQLTWSPEPETGHTMTAAADRSAPVGYMLEGQESMGNGASVRSGHASILLSNGRDGQLALPKQSLIILDVFQGETVEFPVAGLDQKIQAQLRKCF